MNFAHDTFYSYNRKKDQPKGRSSMNRIISLNTLLIIVMLPATSTFAKRPRKEKPPKQPRPALSQEQRDVIVSNVGQVMGGLCAIAQDPHNHHNIGISIASMIHALITIIVEKFAHRTINFNDAEAIEQCLNELGIDISKDITEIIITRNLLHKHKTVAK